MKWFAIMMLALGAVACGSSGDDDDGDDDGKSSSTGSSGSSTSTTTEKFSCSISGDCKKCPTSADVRACGLGEDNDCTSTDSSFCESK